MNNSTNNWMENAVRAATTLRDDANEFWNESRLTPEQVMRIVMKAAEEGECYTIESGTLSRQGRASIKLRAVDVSGGMSFMSNYCMIFVNTDGTHLTLIDQDNSIAAVETTDEESRTFIQVFDLLNEMCDKNDVSAEHSNISLMEWIDG